MRNDGNKSRIRGRKEDDDGVLERGALLIILEKKNNKSETVISFRKKNHALLNQVKSPETQKVLYALHKKWPAQK